MKFWEEIMMSSFPVTQCTWKG